MVKKLASRLAKSGLPMTSAPQPEDSPWSFPRELRFLILLASDLVIVCAALMGSVTLGHERPFFPKDVIEVAVLTGVLLGASVIFIRQGLYRAIIRHMGPQAVWDLVGAVTLIALLLALVTYAVPLDVAPSAPGIFWLLLFFGMGGIRLLAKALYQTSSGH